MKKDNTDTFPDAEHTRWLETHAEDVFLPTVRVQLNWSDVELAVENGGIVATEAHQLWATWAMPGSPTRLGSEGEAPSASPPQPVLESSWAGSRPMPPTTRAVRPPPQQPVGLWFAGGLALGVALVWGFALVRGVPLLD